MDDLKSKVRALLILGFSDRAICEQLTMTRDQLKAIKEQIKEEEVEVFEGATPKDIFANYWFRQLQCVRELNEVISLLLNSDTPQSYSALVSAIRTKSEIWDKVIKVGRELGVIKEELTKPAFEIDPSDPEAVNKAKAMIERELRDFYELARRSGLTDEQIARLYDSEQ